MSDEPSQAEGSVSPRFEAVLIEWLFQHAYQLDGIMRVAGINDAAARREVIKSYLSTLAGALIPDEFTIRVQTEWWAA